MRDVESHADANPSAVAWLLPFSSRSRRAEFQIAVSGQVPVHLMREKEGLSVSKSVGGNFRYPVNTKGVVLELTEQEKKLVSCLTVARKRKSNEWKKIWQKAKYAGYQPIVLNAAMQTALIFKDYQEGAAIYQRLSNAKVPMTLPTYTTAMKLCGKLAQLDEVERLWEELVQMDAVDSRAAGAHIDAAADNGDMQRAAQILDYLEEKQLEPSVVEFTSAINACANAKNADRAKQAQALFDKMVAKGVEPNIVTFVNLLRAFRDEPAQGCVHLLADMEEHDVKPNTVFAENFLYIFLKQPRKGCWTEESVIASHLRKLNPADLQFAKSFIDDLRKANVDLNKSCKLIDSALRTVLRDKFLQSD